jgi:hypothetical protein
MAVAIVLFEAVDVEIMVKEGVEAGVPVLWHAANKVVTHTIIEKLSDLLLLTRLSFLAKWEARFLLSQ